MQQLNDFLNLIDNYIGSSPWFPFALLGVGLFFTIYLKFPQIRFFKFAFKVVKGKFDKAGDQGDTSHFQALTTALSGTVGTGNIAGVALAVHLGGPAALFWMVVTAVIGMCTKFVEVTLSHKYREVAADGSMAGGPMYYMKNKLNMKWLAVVFAVATVLSSFGTGNMPQINSISSALKSTFSIEPWITGAVLSVILAFVIIGGIKRIASVTEKLVPAMAIVYFLGCFSVIFANLDNLIPSITSIFTSLFTTTAATGGFLGATVWYAFTVGVGRGLFSNEAGQGSAPIAHASAKGHEPVSEGMVAILEPFIDTVIICTITGLTLLSSGVWQEKHLNDFAVTDMSILADVGYSDNVKEDRVALKEHLSGENPLPVFTGMLQVENGKIMNNVTVIHARSVAEEIIVNESFGGAPLTGEVEVSKGKPTDGSISFYGKSLIHSVPLTAIAFTKGWFGDYGQYIVSIGILLFAFSTAISWSYYGDRAMTFLWGSSSVKYYRILYVAGFFIAAIADTTIIWTVAAIAIAVMTLPNLIGIFLLRKDMKSTIAAYWKDFKEEYPNEKTPE
jgi:AGCS family alanine or glycine:cation symporter